MSLSTRPLFKPFQTPNLALKNRLVMAPMTRSHSPQGVPGQDVVDYYRRRAEGGIGLIITEGTTINHPVASNDVNIPFFHGEDSLDGWRNVLAAVHAAGGKIFPQLWHMGAQRAAGQGPNPELEAICPFAQAARDAKALGFDGIELHGAHGYLIDQFFWAELNKRDDHYNGSIADRTRFAVEIIRAVRHEVGNDYPVALRFSQFKIGAYDAKLANNPQEFEEFLTPLADAGVDLFHASSRRYWEPEFTDSNLTLAGWTKKISGKPTIAVGSVGLDIDFMSSFGGAESNSTSLDELITRLDNDEFDLIAVGRALISDPAWANKIQQGQENSIATFKPADLATLI